MVLKRSFKAYVHDTFRLFILKQTQVLFRKEASSVKWNQSVYSLDSSFLYFILYHPHI